MRITVKTRHNVRIHLRPDTIKSQRKVNIDEHNFFYEITILDGSRLELSESIPGIPFEEPKTYKIATRIRK